MCSFIWNPSPNHVCNFSISQNIYKKDTFMLFFSFLILSVVTAPFTDDENCLHFVQSSLILLEKVHEKKSSHPSFFRPNTHFKTAYISHPIVLLLSALKNSSLHAFSCKQEAKSSCAYWEEVTSLPCRKYNYSIIRSSRCLIGLVCPVLPFFL